MSNILSNFYNTLTYEREINRKMSLTQIKALALVIKVVSVNPFY